MARQVGAVKRGEDLIGGSCGGLPIDLIGPDGAPADAVLTWPTGNHHLAQFVTRDPAGSGELVFDTASWANVAASNAS